MKIQINDDKKIIVTCAKKQQKQNNEPAPDAIDDTWEKTSTGFVVRFTSKGIQNWAYLTKNGKCENSIKYYTEKDLPADVRHLVKSSYYDFAINSIKEVNCNNATAYLVTIEFKNVWKVIRIINGEMEVWEDHIKS